MNDRIVEPEEVRDDYNILEELESAIDSDDELLAAILKNQSIIAESQAKIADEISGEGGQTTFDNKYPFKNYDGGINEGTVGVAVEDIKSNNVGKVLFGIFSEPIVKRVRVQDDTPRGNPVRVINTDSRVEVKRDDDLFLEMMGYGDPTNIPDGDIDIDVSGALQDAFSGGVSIIGKGSGLRPLTTDGFDIIESNDMSNSQSDGTIEVQPGETKDLVKWNDSGKIAVMAVGATDANQTSFELTVDGGNTVGGETASPLGSINSPFSLINEFKGVVVGGSFSYKASLSSGAAGPVNLAARAYTEKI